MKRSTLQITLFGLFSAALLVSTGCASKDKPVNNPRSNTQLSPGDFASVGAQSEPSQPGPLVQTMREVDAQRNTPAPQQAVQPARPASPAAPAASQPAEESASQSNAASPASAQSQDYAVAGMVGQVNGQPIYADHVFKPLEDQLAALGRRLPAGEFRRQATGLIAGRLNQIVTDALILGEAERDLSETERLGLKEVVKNRREELLRKHGGGSPAVAEAVLLQETGKGLAKTLQDYRQEVLVQRYLRQRLVPRINVSRRDIERYYRENHAQFNPPATRTLRLIRAADSDTASQITQQLEGGEAFADVAGSKLNQFQPDRGGLMENAPGDEVFGFPELNEALVTLKEGQFAGPIDTGGAQWFIYCQKLDRPGAQSLREAQRQIERTLWNQQFRTLSENYRQKLFEEGSYNSLVDMTDSLVDIAVSRYAVQ